MRSPWGILAFLRILSPTFLKLCYRLFTDRRVPYRAKMIVIAAVLYVIIPLDLVPDWIAPFMGYIDDFLALSFGLQIFVRMAPSEVVQEHAVALRWEQNSKRR